MSQADILCQIYGAITTAPEILTPPFIEQLLAKVLPLAESDVDNDAVEEAINELYRQFKDVRDKIKALKRKSLDDYDAISTPGYETIINQYPNLNKLKESLKKRIKNNSNPTPPNAKN
jgi:uncharacterized coiled-coil DUF342 family protein